MPDKQEWNLIAGMAAAAAIVIYETYKEGLFVAIASAAIGMATAYFIAPVVVAVFDLPHDLLPCIAFAVGLTGHNITTGFMRASQELAARPLQTLRNLFKK